MAKSSEEATRSVPSVPKIAFVTRPRSYMQQDGLIREADEIDLLARIMLMGRLHRAFALTGAICTTIAAGIAGTLVHEVVSYQARASGNVRLGHPSGVLAREARMSKDGESWHVEKVTVARPAPRVSEGYFY